MGTVPKPPWYCAYVALTERRREHQANKPTAAASGAAARRTTELSLFVRAAGAARIIATGISALAKRTSARSIAEGIRACG
jgi:hypothetical protein